jgi:hypothetical protein
MPQEPKNPRTLKSKGFRLFHIAKNINRLNTVAAVGIQHIFVETYRETMSED